MQEVRGAARGYLAELADADLDRTVPYEGGLAYLQETGLSLRHALFRLCAHHYFHTGEIASKRSMLGHQVGDFPGALTESL